MSAATSLVVSNSSKVTAVIPYMRVSAISIFLFDYLTTFPKEIRLYRRQKSVSGISLGTVLFILVRYLSIVALVASLLGYLGTWWTPESCKKYFLAVPVTKVIAGWATHLVFISRTWAICNRDKKTLWFLIGLGVSVSIVEIVTNVTGFRQSLSKNGACVSVFKPNNTSYIFYICHVVFDFIILGITAHRLVIKSHSTTRSEFTKMLFGSSCFYFLVVTLSNLVNLICFIHYRTSEATLFATMGIAIQAIMSTHLILDLQELSSRQPTTTLTKKSKRHSAAVGDGTVSTVTTVTYSRGEKVVRTSAQLENGMRVIDELGLEDDKEEDGSEGCKALELQEDFANEEKDLAYGTGVDGIKVTKQIVEQVSYGHS